MSGLVSGSEDHKRGFRRIVLSLIWLVIVPAGSLLALGILMLIFWQVPELTIVSGILVVSLVGLLVTGSVLALVFLRHEANLSKLQTDFVSKVSHELRTPLTSIRMFVDMLAKTHDPEEIRTCHEVLQKETARLSDRIERLLDWGRMEAGRRVYEKRLETVDAIVRASIDAFDAATVGRRAHIDVDVPNDLPSVLVDREAMVDALVNLLSNAYKYTGDEKNITVCATADAKTVRISVIDDGIGIPQSEHRRIFQKFYRVDDRLSREIEGSGLGLSIVRHVATAHGGRVELDSKPGVGSAFTIVLPRSKGAALREAASVPPKSAVPAE